MRKASNARRRSVPALPTEGDMTTYPASNTTMALRTICVIAVTVSFGLAFDLKTAPSAESDAATRRILPLGRQVKVCQEDCVVVRTNNDRGPFVRNIDLTPAGARAIGLNEAGR